MHVRSMIITSAGLLAATGVLTVGTAAPAAAANGPVAYAYHQRGSGYYVDYGDKFKVTDRDGDHRGVVLIWDVGSDGKNWHFDRNSAGFGTTKTFNHAIPEGGKLAYTVCLTKYKSTTIDYDTCGKWKFIWNS